MARNLAEAQNKVCVDDSNLIPDIVSLTAWRRYCTVLSVFKLYGKA